MFFITINLNAGIKLLKLLITSGDHLYTRETELYIHGTQEIKTLIKLD